MKTILLFIFTFFFFCGQAADKVYYTEADRAAFDRYLSTMLPDKSLPTGELMVKTARFFLGVPYVAATLEKEPEGLVINLREMDCMTLVENTVALTRTLQSASPSFDMFCKTRNPFAIATERSTTIRAACIIRPTGYSRTNKEVS